jgi:mRNA interferase RelE/StbE
VANYSILIKPTAVKELDDLPRKDLKRVTEKIKNLAEDPRPVGCEKLSGQERYRVRQGNYRIIYEIEDIIRIVRIAKIGHRKEIYR